MERKKNDRRFNGRYFLMLEIEILVQTSQSLVEIKHLKAYESTQDPAVKEIGTPNTLPP